jgi:hypothetical protein
VFDTQKEGTDYTMTDTNGNGEKGHPVRKLLKSLPGVHATDDFEVRLQRRIAEEESRRNRSGILAWLPGVRRIPVFAYSVVSVMVVGIVSYFLLMRTTPVAPPQERLVIPENKEEIVPAPPVDDLRKKSDSRDQRRSVAQQGPSRNEVAGRSSSEGNELKGKQAEGNILEVAKPREQSVTSKTAIQNNEPASVELAAPRPANEKDVVRSVTQGLNAAAGNSAMFKVDRAFSSANDSAARRDSVRLDSLRRLKTKTKYLKKRPSD